MTASTTGVEPTSTKFVLHHLSHSQITTFTSCPRKWHYEKVEHAAKECLPASLAFGISVHDTLAEVNEASLHGETVPVKDLFITKWKQAVAGDLPVYFGKDDADDLLAKGRALVATYTPPPGIIGVEQPFTVELDPDLPPIEGRIDLIRRDDDGYLTIADLKTSGTKLVSDTNAAEAQLALYDVAYPAAKHELIVLAKLKQPVITVQPITPWSVSQLRNHYRDVHAAMAAGVRFAVYGWHCDGCQFAKRCQQDGCHG